MNSWACWHLLVLETGIYSDKVSICASAVVAMALCLSVSICLLELVFYQNG